MAEQLTAEIFRDYDTPSVDVAPVVGSLLDVRDIIGGLDVIGTRRKLKIGEGSPLLPMGVLRGVMFDADFNVIVTDRPILPPGATPVVAADGRLIAPGNSSSVLRTLPHLTRLAYVSSTGEHLMKPGTIHQFGHLLDMRPKEAVGKVHCSRPDCIMTPAAEQATISGEPQVDIELKIMLGKLGVAAIPKVENAWLPSSMCDDCQDHAGMRAFYMREAKNGKTVPGPLLPHGAY